MLRIAGSADHRPTLWQGINLAFRIGPGAERFAAVEPGAAIPLTVPGVLMDVLPQLPRLGQAAFGKGGIAARAGQWSKLDEHVVKKESQPDAFAASLVAHPVHAVIPVTPPHQRQTVFAEFESTLDGAHAMLVKRRDSSERLGRS